MKKNAVNLLVVIVLVVASEVLLGAAGVGIGFAAAVGVWAGRWIERY